jgi:hypothetical protein
VSRSTINLDAINARVADTMRANRAAFGDSRMVAAAVMQPQPRTRDTRQRGSEGAVVPTVPFIRASAEHREPAGIDVSRLMTAASQDLGVFDIPAVGYVRSLFLVVTATGGSGTSVTAGEDGPFNCLTNVALTEPNGAIIAQFNTGYDLYLANKWGGQRHVLGSDARQSPTFSNVAGATGNFTFVLRVPVELNLRDSLGSLPNQNAAATFKLRATLNASTNVYGTVPTTLPTVRVRAYIEAWDQPEASAGGLAQQVTPPAMNTTSFWTSQQFNVTAGNNSIRLTRVGNYIRELILVHRRAGTSRLNGEADIVAVDPLTLMLDTRPLDIIEPNNFRHQQFERSGFGGTLGATTPANDAPGGLDNGVRAYDFAHEFDGTLGHENRDLWLPTLGSTRLELQGSFANAGVLTVLTNDVAIAGTVFI